MSLVIVGAGAAGIGAAKAAEWIGIDYVLVEASHRIGGRAYTENPMPGIHFDLGCHWLHTASRNPFTQLISPYGMEVAKQEPDPGYYQHGLWIEPSAMSTFESDAYAQMHKLANEDKDYATVEVYDRESEWTGMLDYWVSLNTSTDPDLVSFRDFTDFEYTGEGEDWPVRQGLGTMVSRFGSRLPVQLNTPVKEIDCSGSCAVVRTTAGDLQADAVIVTVSTGILNAGDVRFTPELPLWKREAIDNLQIGNHNRICLIYDRNVFGDYAKQTSVCLDDEDPPMYFEIRPFGLNYAVGSTGGRFADWLERAGQQASIDYARERLMRMFGSDAGQHIEKTVVTAWRGDPWVRGAYSATTPGAHGARALLSDSVDERLYFAGEATSPNFMDTMHGAFISGVREVLKVAATRSGESSPTNSDAEELAWKLMRTGRESQTKHREAGAV